MLQFVPGVETSWLQCLLGCCLHGVCTHGYGCPWPGCIASMNAWYSKVLLGCVCVGGCMIKDKVSLEVAIILKSSLLCLFHVAPSGSFGSSSMEDADPAVPIWQLQTASAGKQLCLHYNPTGWSVCHQDAVSFHSLFPLIRCFSALHLISSDKVSKSATYISSVPFFLDLAFCYE